ncbi:MAG: 50S ribosomal protein L9 [Candidatus Ancaeobacter aquaticus]|nr:50S ribosomal protein L9 [Candidatus Ancaeobacter aquaticus]
MEVLLARDVERVGKSGDIVKVKDGYARNFLLPQKFAVIATPDNIKRLEVIKRKREEEEQKKVEALKVLADQISKLSCTITAKSGEDDALYGSVSSQDIAAALVNEGVQIDKKQIEIAEPIKALGLFTVKVKVHSEIDANLKVWVIKDKG